MKDTGERMIPQAHHGQLLYGEHIVRYQAAKETVSGKVVLDIASGTGYGTNILSQKAQKVFGVDVSKDAIEYAKKNYSGKNIEFILGDASKIPLQTNQVDVVVSFETIEHIPNYKEFIKEVKRVLKPGGFLIVSTPNDDEYPEDNEFHVHEFTLEEFKDLMRKEFNHQEYYYQASWFYTGVFDEKKFTGEWESNIATHKVSKISKNKAPYFIAICSMNKIGITLNSVGSITKPWSDRDNIEYTKGIQNRINELEQQNIDLQKKLGKIQNSKPWKAAKKVKNILNKEK